MAGDAQKIGLENTACYRVYYSGVRYGTYCGLVMYLADINISDMETLSFYIKGLSGGEKPNIYERSGRKKTMKTKMKRKILTAPSILSADFSSLGTEIKRIERAGADMVHIDVMDGHFVPNITIGPLVVRDMRKITKLPLDVHLMIEEPAKYIDEFKKAGSDIITIHAESKGDIKALLRRIRSFGLKAGVSLKPKNELDMIKDYLDCADMVLIMTVEPGFGGQKFMKEVLPKIKQLRKIYDKDIEVDGGINKETARDAVNAGANILVAGMFVFGSKDVKKAISSLRTSGCGVQKDDRIR